MTRWAYFNKQIVPIEEAKVSVMTHTFNYGTGAFAGIRAYWNEQEEELFVFRIVDHYRRFLNSGRILMAQVDESAEELAAITLEMLAREGYREDCYIRPLLYKSDEIIGVRLHNLHDAITIFSVPFGRYIEAEEGAKVCTSSWRRVDDTAIPPRGKLIGSYMNSALIKSEAQLNGFDEAIVLDQSGHVSEGSAENFFIVRNGVLITPGFHGNILEGITRRTLMQLAGDLGIEVEEREIDRSEVYYAEEAFFCGTGVQVAAIASVDHRPIGNGGIGPITGMLRDIYFRVVRGMEPRYREWLAPVYGEGVRASGESSVLQVS